MCVYMNYIQRQHLSLTFSYHFMLSSSLHLLVFSSSSHLLFIFLSSLHLLFTPFISLLKVISCHNLSLSHLRMIPLTTNRSSTLSPFSLLFLFPISLLLSLSLFNSFDEDVRRKFLKSFQWNLLFSILSTNSLE